MYLVRMHFIAFLTALQSIATGSEASVSTIDLRDSAGKHFGRPGKFVFRRANVVSVDGSAADPLTTITTADISAVTERRRATSPHRSRSAASMICQT
ncbi:MAG: hypothetical protein IPO41_05530 [Acidobacteria bacterium]|nr:hypothetical protein [Acidobacteriota bacterium]